MIELDVEQKRKAPEAHSDAKNRYLVLGDFGGRTTDPLTVDRDNINDVLTRLEVKLAGAPLRDIEDFHPDRLYRSSQLFGDLRDAASAEPEPAARASEPRADLGKILSKTGLLEQIAEGGDPFQKYVEELARAHAVSPKAPDTQRIAACGERMRAVLHHPRFQALEAAWRGLDYVVRNMDEEVSRIQIAQFSRRELERDLAETADLRSTRTYKLLHHYPWRAVFGLYSFGPSDADADLLGRIALLAGDARAPFFAEGSADMGAHWEELRGIPEAKYTALLLPRFLVRLPYGAKASAIESFEFEEMSAIPAHGDYLWGNPALAGLAVVARGGADAADGLNLDHLPLHSYKQDGEWKTTPCAEVLMTEPEVSALMDLGLMPLISFRDTDRIRLAGFRAINGGALPLWS
jgi:type VI secretion system protein ImpC